MAIAKHDIEQALHAEKQQISSGRLKEDNPLDDSPQFQQLCQACRRGDLGLCHELIQQGVNVNGRDVFDYTPLILVCHKMASLSSLNLPLS
jgi:ankyrin repeat/BTB/POZ domain-containing protein 1